MNFNKSPIFKRLTTTGFLPKPGVFFPLHPKTFKHYSKIYTHFNLNFIIHHLES